MFLDVANPSIIDDIDGENIMFIAITVVIILCIIGIIIYKKVRNERRKKNEEY